MELETLGQLYVDELKDLYSSETQILKALPKMVKAASHPELKKAFETHLKQTQGHVERLEQICDDLGVSPKGKKCAGMEGVIKEGAEVIQEKPDADVLDAGLIGAAHRVEHYEMAGYATVIAFATKLGHDRQVALLQQTLDEERETDELLTELAEQTVNVDAMHGESAESDEDGPADRAPRRSATSATKRPAKSTSDRAMSR